MSLTQDDQSGKTKLRHSQSYSFESHGNFVYPWESAIFFLIRRSVMNGFGKKKKKKLTFGTWNKSTVTMINRMLIWCWKLVCVLKVYCLCWFHIWNGSKIVIVQFIKTLNDFWMDKDLIMTITMPKLEDTTSKNKFWCCECEIYWIQLKKKTKKNCVLLAIAF